MKHHDRNLREIMQEKKRKKLGIIIIFIMITLFIIYRGVFSLILISSNISITAHRGSTGLAPENTIASVVEALALDVDYIEIDVQLSKDEKVFLLHDVSFNRTAKVKANPWNLTYEEIEKINVGAYKTDTLEFSAPLLEDVIKVCMFSNVKLNIELKDYGHSEDLPERVVEIINENEFEDQCVITSSSQRLLRKVRILNPNIRIGLITSSASFRTYIENSFVDFYSVRYLVLSPSIVVYAHSRHKEIFCWTPNNKIEIQAAIHAGADNIITDNITLTKLLIISSK